MTASDFTIDVLFPVFFLSAVVWLCCILFFRNHLPEGRFICAPFAMAKKGGLLGWIGALSSGGLILCFVIIALMQFLSFFRLFR